MHAMAIITAKTAPTIAPALEAGAGDVAIGVIVAFPVATGGAGAVVAVAA